MSINNCGCTQTNPCGQPTCQETSCACPVYIKSDCVTEVTANFECLPIASNLPLNETLEAMDSAICDKFDEVDSHFQLVNIGTGSEVYKGVNLLGQKEIRKINAVGDLVTVTQNTNDISVSIDETELTTFVEDLIPNYNAENLGTGAEVFKEETANTFRFRTITSTDNTVDITEGTNTIDLSVTVVPSDINITAGANVTVTEPTPNNFVVTSTDTDTIVELEDGVTTNVIGDGVTTPYSVEVLNLQKKITSDYTLLSTDNHHTIVVDTTAGDVDITVPTGLVANISVNFTQIGTGVVTFVGSGTTLNSPIGLKIKGENYWANIYKRADVANTFQLAGALMI